MVHGRACSGEVLSAGNSHGLLQLIKDVLLRRGLTYTHEQIFDLVLTFIAAVVTQGALATSYAVLRVYSCAIGALRTVSHLM